MLSVNDKCAAKCRHTVLIVSSVSFFVIFSPYINHYGNFSVVVYSNYHNQPNYRTYPYKHTVKQFRSLQITTSVLFSLLFLKPYVVGTHLNCINLSMQFT